MGSRGDIEEEEYTMTLKTLIYTFLTNTIILLSKLRDKCLDGPSHNGHLRIDRVLPWYEGFGSDKLFMGCCDCGLTHFLVLGHSITPVRPINYQYKMRMGGKAWVEPNTDLADVVLEKAKNCHVVD